MEIKYVDKYGGKFDAQGQRVRECRKSKGVIHDYREFQELFSDYNRRLQLLEAKMEELYREKPELRRALPGKAKSRSKRVNFGEIT